MARAEGVGPKLAQRIVNELKDKVGDIALGRRRASAAPRRRRCGRRRRDAVSALVNLGYQRADAYGAVAAAARVLGPQAALDALIRAGPQGARPMSAPRVLGGRARARGCKPSRRCGR